MSGLIKFSEHLANGCWSGSAFVFVFVLRGLFVFLYGLGYVGCILRPPCVCVCVCARVCVYKWPVSHLKAVSPPQMMNPSYVFDVVRESRLRI